jgi:hypothetical protein
MLMTTLTDVTLPLGHKLHVNDEAYNEPLLSEPQNITTIE